MSKFFNAISQPRFVVCAVVLLAMAVGMAPADKATGQWLKKRPVPIRKPLKALDRGKLSGFHFIEDVGYGWGEVVDTEEYIGWRFAPTANENNPRNVAYLSVYYYTNTSAAKTLSIPHTAEVCGKQDGHQVTDLGSVDIPTPGLAPDTDSIQAKYVRLSHPTIASNKDFVVVYVFCVNGEFYSDREKARLHLGMPWSRAVYVVKIECHVPVPGPDRLQEAIETCKKMLGKAIPEFVREHFPTRADIDRALGD